MKICARVLAIAAVLALAAGPALSAATLTAPDVAMSAPTSHAPSAPLRGVLSLLGSGVVFGITIKKDIGSIAQKFVTRAQAAAGDYKTGVANAGGAWEQNTVAAEPNYDQGVQAAITAKRFGKGVAGKGGKYQTNAVNLGSQRYGPGVANAQSAYQTGMAPVLQTLQALSLPPKSFRGSPQNQGRSNAVATALAAMRANK